MNKLGLFFLFLALCAGPSFQRPFNIPLAIEMLRASTTAYCPSNHLLTWQCGDACENLQGYSFVNQITMTISDNDRLSFTLLVNRKEQRFIVSFRGTNTKTQLFNEISNSRAVTYDLYPLKNAVASGYFYNNYKNRMRYDLMNRVKQAANGYPDYDFYFVGHSLGGAFATLAALDASLGHIIDKDRIHLYTYGCPRVGDFNFANAVVNNVGEIQRVTHHRDMVPHVPPCQKDIRGNCVAAPDHGNENGVLTFHAFHVWPEIFFDLDDGKTFKVCPFAEDSNCSNQYTVTLSIDDHLNYMGMSTRCMKNGAILV